MKVKRAGSEFFYYCLTVLLTGLIKRVGSGYWVFGAGLGI